MTSRQLETSDTSAGITLCLLRWGRPPACSTHGTCVAWQRGWGATATCARIAQQGQSCWGHVALAVWAQPCPCWSRRALVELCPHTWQVPSRGSLPLFGLFVAVVFGAQ